MLGGKFPKPSLDYDGQGKQVTRFVGYFAEKTPGSRRNSLAQDQEPGSAGHKARGGRGLGLQAIGEAHLTLLPARLVVLLVATDVSPSGAGSKPCPIRYR
jgi:hypothetical protein